MLTIFWVIEFNELKANNHDLKRISLQLHSFSKKYPKNRCFVLWVMIVIFSARQILSFLDQYPFQLIALKHEKY